MNNVYRFEINRKCNRCPLSTGKAVAGQSAVPFNQVKLIVVSSYPGKAEENVNMSLAPDTGRRSNSGQKPAGVFFRESLHYLFDSCEDLPDLYKPFENYVYYTNVIKCRKSEVTITEKARDTCKSTWLDKELLLFNPYTPILLAGSDPVKGVLGKEYSIYSERNKVLYYKKHPVIVTENPINIEKGILSQLVASYSDTFDNVRTILNTKMDERKKQSVLDKVIKTKLIPPLFGMSTYFFKQDMLNLREEVIKFINVIS